MPKRKREEADIEKIRILHQNIRYGGNKFLQIREMLEKERHDVCMFSEVKLEERLINLYFGDVRGYKLYLQPRAQNPNSGGGLLIFVSNSVKVTETANCTKNDMEIMSLELELVDEQLQIIYIYNPPRVKLNLEGIRKVIKQEKFIIAGDLNARHKSLGSLGRNANGVTLAEFVAESGIEVVNKGITFQGTNNYREKLDYIICSEQVLARVSESTTINTGLNTDHLAITCEMNLKNYREAKKPLKEITKVDWAEFKSILQQKGPCDKENIESDYARIISEIQQALQEATKPIPRREPSRYTLPSSIRTLKKSRNNLLNLKKEWETDRYDLSIEILNKEIKEKIHELGCEQLTKCLNRREGKNPLSSCSNIFRFVNKMAPRKSMKIHALTIGSRDTSDDQEITEGLATAMEQTFNAKNTELKFDELSKARHEEKRNKFEELLKTNLARVRTLHSEEIIESIRGLNGKKTLDKHKISNHILKQLPNDYIKNRILPFFNSILQENTLPSSWKASEIIMIPKKPGINSKIVKNLRPISITDTICRLMERLVLKELQEHLEANNILDQNQSGFRKKRQTHDNIFALSQKVAETVARGKRGLLLAYDIQAAFDSVQHAFIISKLIDTKAPVWTIRWINEFLKNRSFKIRNGALTSTSRPITTGVPQGSVISPTLFSVFINDVPKANRSNRSLTIMFADDIAQLFMANDLSGPGTIRDIQKAITNIETWSAEWWVKFSPTKCCGVRLNDNKAKSGEGLKLLLYGEEIPLVREVSVLGVIFDEACKFEANTDKVISICRNRLSVLKISSRRKLKIPKKTRQLIYTSLIRSVIEYSCLTYNALDGNNKLALERIQKAAVKISNNLPTRYSSDSLKLKHNLPTIEQRLKELGGRYLEKALENDNKLVTKVVREFKNFRNDYSKKRSSTKTMITT